nr:hypothetical protein Iba_chr10bCG10160 [Ipomoea batatas]
MKMSVSNWNPNLGFQASRVEYDEAFELWRLYLPAPPRHALPPALLTPLAANAAVNIAAARVSTRTTLATFLIERLAFFSIILPASLSRTRTKLS